MADNKFVMLEEAGEKSDVAGELVMKLFHTRTNAHVLHLKTRSYAAHKALDEFYNGIVDLADRFAESYQGVYGLLNINGTYEPVTDPVSMLQNLRSWIEKRRAQISDESEHQNIIDEIFELVDGTLYKLRFLS